jgi:hypothetical protein
MRSVSIVLASALALGGCATSGGIDPPSGTVPVSPISSGNATVDAIIGNAVKGCGFLPTFETAAGILSTFVPQVGPGVDIADMVAKAICRAVLPGKSAGRMSFRRGDAEGLQINGVLIEGRFIR